MLEERVKEEEYRSQSWVTDEFCRTNQGTSVNFRKAAQMLSLLVYGHGLAIVLLTLPAAVQAGDYIYTTMGGVLINTLFVI